MYSEQLLKIRAKKRDIEHMLMLQGKYPHKVYIDRLLASIDTKLSLLDYKRTAKDTQFDVNKFNEDIDVIYRDLCILFILVDEIAIQKYTELEAFTNGFLLSLEAEADKTDLRAREELESTTLNADIVFFGEPSTLTYNNEIAIYDMGNLEFKPQSKVLGTVTGTGFELEDVVFEIGDKRISEYNLSMETYKLGGEVTKNTYSYELMDNKATTRAFKVAVQDLSPDESYDYNIYGDKGCISVVRNGKMEEHVQLSFDTSITPSAYSTYSFYLHNATYIDFDFSSEPVSKNFSSYINNSLQRDDFTEFKFAVQSGCSFSISSDGIVYASKEEAAVNGDDLYIAGNTASRSFDIVETIPGPNIILPVKMYVYNAKEDVLNIKSVAIKEIADISGGVVL